MTESGMSKILITIGCILIVLGVIWYFYSDKLGFIGNLPGDIRIQRDNFSFYFPITTMLLLSVLINIGFRLFKYFTTI